MNIIKELSEKPRVAGTKRNKEIVDFLIKELRKYGYQTKTQNFPFTGWKLINKPKLKIFDKPVKVLSVVWSGSTKRVAKGYLRKAGEIKTFEAYEWARYAIIDNQGKIKGYIISRPDKIWGQLIDKKSSLPYFMVYPATHKQIEANINKKKIFVEYYVKTKFIKNLKISNVITKNNSKKRIIICAHLDSFPNSPGANDNASGVATLLEIAKTNKNENIQYVLFNAEEFNKFGSYNYVRKLSRRDLKKIKTVVNLDMLGAGNLYCICSKKFEKIVRKCAANKKMQISTKPRPPFDYWPFYKKGVPIIHFGGSPYNYCHDSEDNIDKINPKPIKEAVSNINNLIHHFSLK